MDEVEQDTSGFMPVLGVVEVSPDNLTLVVCLYVYFSSQELSVTSFAFITSRGFCLGREMEESEMTQHKNLFWVDNVIGSIELEIKHLETIRRLKTVAGGRRERGKQGGGERERREVKLKVARCCHGINNRLLILRFRL